jgi:hypothetical protein
MISTQSTKQFVLASTADHVCGALAANSAELTCTLSADLWSCLGFKSQEVTQTQQLLIRPGQVIQNPCCVGTLQRLMDDGASRTPAIPSP